MAFPFMRASGFFRVISQVRSEERTPIMTFWLGLLLGALLGAGACAVLLVVDTIRTARTMRDLGRAAAAAALDPAGRRPGQEAHRTHDADARPGTADASFWPGHELELTPAQAAAHAQELRERAAATGAAPRVACTPCARVRAFLGLGPSGPDRVARATRPRALPKS